MLEDLEMGELEFQLLGDFLAKLKEFSREDNKSAKVVEFKKVE